MLHAQVAEIDSSPKVNFPCCSGMMCLFPSSFPSSSSPSSFSRLTLRSHCHYLRVVWTTLCILIRLRNDFTFRTVTPIGLLVGFWCTHGHGMLTYLLLIGDLIFCFVFCFTGSITSDQFGCDSRFQCEHQFAQSQLLRPARNVPAEIGVSNR